MERFPYYLGVPLTIVSVTFLFLLMLQPGFAYEAISVNPVTLATILTVALLFTAGLGLALAANMSRKGVVRNTLRKWLIVWTIEAIGVVVFVAAGSALFSGVYSPPPNEPQVAAILTSCSGDPETCAITLYNTGTVDGETTSKCSLTFGGATHSATSTVQTIQAVAPAVLVTCTASAGTAPSGSQISGLIYMVNGGSVVFQYPPAG